MKKTKRKSLQAPREAAFQRQHGYCYYCEQPMWRDTPDELTSRFDITPKQAARLQCTGEHLAAHSKGGSCNQSNIVAACLHCNNTHHHAKQAKAPPAYRAHVQKRLGAGKWFAPLRSAARR